MNIILKNILVGILTFTVFMSFGAIHSYNKLREGHRQKARQEIEQRRWELKIDRILNPEFY